MTGPQHRCVNDDLTTREVEVLQFAADGLLNDEIGRRLWISRNTVKSHFKSAAVKLGTNGEHDEPSHPGATRAHSVAVALRRGLIR